MKIKAILISLFALVVVMMGAVSASANARSFGSGVPNLPRALTGNIVQDDPVNTPPTADSQDVSTAEDTSKPITLTGSDPDLGDILAFSIVSQPANGSLSGSPPNITYTPNENYYGPDSFTFKINDGTTDSNDATVSITVTPVNDPPVANNQSVNVTEDVAKGITLTASDPDSNTLTYTVVTQPTKGTLTGSGATRTYTPNTNYFGNDSFTFKVNDGTVDSNTATVSIIVEPVNDAPIVVSPIADFGVQEDAPDTTIDLKPVFQDVEDSDNDLNFTVQSGGNAAIFNNVAINSGGVLTIKYKNNATGQATLVIRATDTGTPPLWVEDSFVVTVTGENDKPTANPQSVEVDEDTPKAITLTGSDPDGDPLNYAIVTGPEHGTLSGTGANRTYTPDENYYGPDSFTFKVNDGTTDSDPATVNITVKPKNDPPVANPQSVTTDEDTPKNIILTASDVDGDSLNFNIVDYPEHGTLSGTPPNVTYTPDGNFSGSDSFTFRAFDGSAYSNVATVSIEVQGINDAPVIALSGGPIATHAAGGSPVIVKGTGITITDSDSNNLSGATIRIINLKHPGDEILDASVGGTGIGKSYNATTGVLTLTGEATRATYEGVLQTVTYRIASGVASVNTAERDIGFQVKDSGGAISNEATAKVKVIFPRIKITVTPQGNQPYPKPTTVFFDVVIQNIGSNVALLDIKTTATAVTECAKNLSGEELDVNEQITYTCSQSKVEENFDNTVVVTAKDAVLGTTVTAQDTAEVRVLSDITIDIYHKTGSNTLNKGQDANFRVTVLNPTGQDLTKITVKPYLSVYDIDTSQYTEYASAAACGKANFSLDPGDDLSYDCTIPDVDKSFRIRVEAVGYVDGWFETDDFDTEEILVPDLFFEVSAEPFAINAGQPTPVQFNLLLTNRSNVPLTLTGLQSDQHGNVLGAGLTDNTCPGINKSMPESAVRTCSYQVVLTVDPPAFINSITATATYGGGKSLSVSDEGLVIAGDFSPLDITLVANPSSLVAPGGTVELTLSVTNNTSFNLTIDSLVDSVVGDIDGLGNCETPYTIPGNEFYTCTYPVSVTGKEPGDIVTHTITSQADSAQATDTVAIAITTEIHTQILLPAVSKLSVSGEPHNTACTSMPIMVNLSYYSLADDDWDWYRFTLDERAIVKVRLNNFLASGHLMTYYTSDCSQPGSPIKHNGDLTAQNRVLDLGLREVGTYYVAVYSASNFNTASPYALQIESVRQ